MDYSEKSHTELVQIQNNQIKQQDEILDNMLQTTGVIAVNMKTLDLALKEDKKIINELNKKVEQATDEIKDTTSKMKTLLSYTNDWCLWIIILVEVVVFIFLVIN
ncbi:unnamed protein product (macronuclear) [Paramecium tetraurelia]|uniref:t-SNARE coiled-coil homology domain-containing protein n=1 Tax=Paramecium tetraurelia TaxID=5888 RepID=A0BB78_PARTE|nr:uncharacterized protein GSPATT00000230001 [Paramecium tetraurelia]CAK55795.1 unnamed protein product [Paramecium tetraurelia]|eukprot:XP_001423193.1 hypothetical protein (macronuclear) [Paramecium tetraurelia strain d4-2]